MSRLGCHKSPVFHTGCHDVTAKKRGAPAHLLVNAAGFSVFNALGRFVGRFWYAWVTLEKSESLCSTGLVTLVRLESASPGEEISSYFRLPGASFTRTKNGENGVNQDMVRFDFRTSDFPNAQVTIPNGSPNGCD